MGKNQIEPNFEFGKKIAISEHFYGDIPAYLNLIGKLLVCMQETNKLNGKECEFFRIDFRQMYRDEQFQVGGLIFDMKWGCKEEMAEDKITRISDEDLENYANEALTKEIIWNCENEILKVMKFRFEKYPTEINDKEWLDYTNFICRRRGQRFASKALQEEENRIK